MLKDKPSRIISIIAGLIVGAAAMYLVGTYTGLIAVKEVPKEPAEGEPVTKEKNILYWRAPMDPTFISDKPGKSPMGMDLIPVYEGEEEVGEPGTVRIDPVTIQNIGVRTTKIKRKPLIRTIRTIGTVAYDEKKVYHVHTKIEGWIEKLYVDFTGQKVKKDDILLEIYSPQLVSTQEEYLLALKYSEAIEEAAPPGTESIRELSRRRLELWDVPAHQIKELEETGSILKTLHIHSPAGGIVTEKSVVEGMFVKPGTSLYTIADISKVWVYADIYEYELPWIKEGQEAKVTLEAYPGRVFRGRVSFIYPFMEPRTRTNKVRLVFDNPEGELKPDMYANVTLASVVSPDALGVPTEAVIRSGERNIVVLSRGGGKFRPVEITLGPEAEEYYLVIEGLTEGDEVVTSAQFLIDSESRLKEAITKMLEAEVSAEEPVEHESMKKMEHEPMEDEPMDKPEDTDETGEGVHGEHSH
jgi:RND family efflux transporter MFP subunit